jgi:hypothetical protein
MELSDREKLRLGILVKGGKLGDVPTGPFLEHFDPFEIAIALEQEATRAELIYDNPKVDLRMDASDARELARILKSLPRSG